MRAGVKDIRRTPPLAAQPSDDVGRAKSEPRPETEPKPDPESKIEPAPIVRPTPELRVVAQQAKKAESTGDDRAKALAEIAAQVARCKLCPNLVANRTQTVFGTGDPYAELCFIGEGPGAEEDARGVPFVGRSGQLLTDMIEKGMKIKRESVFICNIVRCRPPQNRNPERREADNCRPFLDATLDVVKPKYICCLGSIAATNLLDVDVPIGKLRGVVQNYNGAKVVCTYHPAYLLRNPAAKKQAWEDLQLLMREMGLLQ